MEGPFLSGSSPRRRRYSKPSAAAAGPTAWLHRHPVAAAAVHMLLGGCIVYYMLSSTSHRQQQQPPAGTLRLSAAAAAAVQPAAPAPDTFTASSAPGVALSCSDTCFKARDGVCDDGRFLHNMSRGLPSRVVCDLGSDCSDCGPWRGVAHSSSWQEPIGPVEYLRQHNLTLLTKKSAFEPRIHFAFTDPAHDIDDSRAFAGLSALEVRLSHIAYHVLHAPCQQGAAVEDTSSNSSDTGSSSDAGSSSGDSSSDAGGSAAQQHEAGGGLEQQVVPEGLMVDVGAGFGWYSLMAGRLGCRVIVWEPVKAFQAYLEYGIARNKLQHKVEVRAAAAVGPSAGSNASSTSIQQLLLQQRQRQQQPQPQQVQLRKLQARKQRQQQQQQQQQQHRGVQLQSPSNVTVVAPTRGMWSTASISGRSIYLALSAEGQFLKYTVPGETLDDVLLPLLQQDNHQQQQQQGQQQQRRRQHSHIALLKVDVEGHEPQVLSGASQLLSGGLVDNVLLEYTPHVAESHNVTQAVQYPQMLLQLLDAGFSLGHVPDISYSSRPLSTYSEPLHQLQAITRDNLKYDLVDCLQMTEVGSAWLHEPCTEMLSYGLISEGIPQRLHPKSFRSCFEVNTHVWATRHPRYTPYLQGPPVGVFPPNRKLTTSWFVEETSVLDRAMGGRSCANLREVAAHDKLDHRAKASFLISHRCRCALVDSPCADEESLAEGCAQSGRTPFREEPDYVPDR